MISVEEALDLILQHKKDFGTEEVSLLKSMGRVLAQPVKADRDMPPFDRVTMDGIAIAWQAFAAGRRAFFIEKIQAAGVPQQQLENLKNCIEVMTGAILSKDADTVIPYEACEIAEGVATIKTETIKPYHNIHHQGTDSQAGDVLLQTGERITPARIAILASVGMAAVQVRCLPKVAIFSTGDELVEVTQQPEPHQIRKSNVYMLASALLAEGVEADMFHLPDDAKEMTQQLASAIDGYQVLLFSGAVSKGKYDYLPSVLEHLGMQRIFHGVAQKPGKPLLFGSFPGKALVFGFPGNPVSSFVCYHIFFKPWLQASIGIKHQRLKAALTQEVIFKPQLTYHLPVQLTYENGETFATSIAGSGSGDLTSIIHADAILTLPAEREKFNAGEVFAITVLGYYL